MIADKFNISTSSILWANGFSKNTVLKPGQTIKIPPVSGLVYTVQAGETMKSLSEKFKVEDVKIASQNKLTTSSELLI